MALIGAAIFFAIYISNVVMGALLSSSFMGDVQEMLVLLCASVLFVTAILKAERDFKKNTDK